MGVEQPLFYNFSCFTVTKTIIIGEQAVGKSSILGRFCDSEFSLNMIGTVGVDCRKKTVNVEGKDTRLTIFDTAGQERFRNITKSFYQGTKGVILVFDVSDKITFENLKDWLKTIKDSADEGVHIMLVANKIDLERAVSTEEIKTFATSSNVPFTEASAKTGININKAFEGLLKNIVNSEKLKNVSVKKEDETNININPPQSNDDKRKKASGCCSG